MAQLNPRIVADVIEANEFEDLSARYNVMSVPKTVINDLEELIGAQPEQAVLAAIRATLGTQAPPEAAPPA